MMTKQEQIATFLDQHITLPRVVGPYGPFAHADPFVYSYADIAHGRPSVEHLAGDLLAHTGFQTLNLGTWLGTTDGEVIAQAVEMVSPPFYRQDVQLLVAALRHAAALQQQEGQRVAGQFALGAVAAAAVVALFISSAGSVAGHLAP